MAGHHWQPPWRSGMLSRVTRRMPAQPCDGPMPWSMARPAAILGSPYHRPSQPRMAPRPVIGCDNMPTLFDPQ